MKAVGPERRTGAIVSTTTYRRHPRTEQDPYEENSRRAHERAPREFPGTIFERRPKRAIGSGFPEPAHSFTGETQYELVWLRDLDDRGEEMPVAIQRAFAVDELIDHDTLRRGAGH
jgi:hypothetical protein